jgi:hypothetical protein
VVLKKSLDVFQLAFQLFAVCIHHCTSQYGKGNGKIAGFGFAFVYIVYVNIRIIKHGAHHKAHKPANRAAHYPAQAPANPFSEF